MGERLYARLCVVTVNYNLALDTVDCVRSLMTAGASIEQIVVVDNASTDDSIEVIRQSLGSQVKIIKSDENKGYAYGLNLGIAYGLAQDFEWLLLINNDTIVDSQMIYQLNSAAQSGAYHLLGPVILYHAQPNLVWSMGDYRIKGTLFGYSPFAQRPVNPEWPDLIPVDFLNGCCMFIHRSVFEQVGQFDADLFMYGEEVDFCWRAHLVGYPMATVSKAVMWHKVSGSSRKVASQSLYLRVRNQNLFYRRYSGILRLPLMLSLSLLRNVLRAVLSVMRFDMRSAVLYLRGWLDGWFCS